MIMIIALIYIFLSDVIFDQQLKITVRKSSAPAPQKIHSRPSLKIQKVQFPPFLPTLKIFQPPNSPPPPSIQSPAERGRDTVIISINLIF